MIQIQLSSVKAFMNQLLCSDVFDDFSCVLGEITTFNTFTMDGFIHKEFVQPADKGQKLPSNAEQHPSTVESEYSLWADLRNYSYSLIKGQKLPLRFKFVFKLPSKEIEPFIAKYHLETTKGEIQGLYFIVRYENQSLYATTGTTLKTFSLSKDIEKAWDTEFIALMDHLKMDYTIS